MTNNQFRTFIDRVVARPTYIRHFVLDRGAELILVMTKVGNFAYDKKGWSEVDNTDAIRLCNSCYFPQFTKYFV